MLAPNALLLPPLNDDVVVVATLVGTGAEVELANEAAPNDDGVDDDDDDDDDDEKTCGGGGGGDGTLGGCT